MIEFRKHITRSMLSSERSTLFVFGVNLERKGKGGPAKEMCELTHETGNATHNFRICDA